jgi:hypothetical protein
VRVTGAEVLKSELAKSEISEKYYRGDESAQSVVSGKSGHVSEFIQCHETRQRLAPTEAEQCQVTGHHVRPGILQACEVSEKRVLPNQLERCASSGKKALKSFMVTSSVSDARVLEALAVRSAAGNYCLPTEAQICSWSGEQIHPDDIRTCELTGLTIHSRFAGNTVHPRLQVLTALLDGTRRSADAQQSWDSICQHLKSIVGWGRCTIEAAVLSPDKRHLAVCCADWQILRTRYVGALYTVDEQVVEGRIAIGKRTTQGWSPVH